VVDSDGMIDIRTPEERLVAAGNLYLNACEERSGYMADLKRVIREADEAGVPRRKIAQLAGISPQTVYDALNEARETGHDDMAHDISRGNEIER
jgi:hypothetical protein